MCLRNGTSDLIEVIGLIVRRCRIDDPPKATVAIDTGVLAVLARHIAVVDRHVIGVPARVQIQVERTLAGIIEEVDDEGDDDLAFLCVALGRVCHSVGVGYNRKSLARHGLYRGGVCDLQLLNSGDQPYTYNGSSYQRHQRLSPCQAFADFKTHPVAGEVIGARIIDGSDEPRAINAILAINIAEAIALITEAVVLGIVARRELSLDHRKGAVQVAVGAGGVESGDSGSRDCGGVGGEGQ